MRKAKFDSAPAGTLTLVVGYIPNFETTGQMWRKNDTLVYAENPFALNRLGNIIRGWSGLIELKPDDPLFFEAIQIGIGWRWDINQFIVP